MTRILITGAAGSIGRMLRTRLAQPGRALRLLDVVPQEDTGDGAELLTADATDLEAMTAACHGADAVVHLAGIPGERPWQQISAVNLDGTYIALEAARRAGVSRVVLASSNHAAGFSERGDGDLPADAAGAPDTFYGVTKAAMEAMGKLYHARFGMDVIALRIGSCFPEPFNVRSLATWLSPDDCGRLVEAALTAPSPGYRVVWGVSANTRRWWSLAEGEAIGYHPADDAEAHAARILAAQPEPDWAGDPDLYRAGGQFCRTELGGSSG
ncbi:NAD-dependent epimerase/dehydratase family protein [Longispora albida]|uniref:NAD-dependent epimerase/dehydratase family protein n=1 Tax=Longispora albida TaxID=203523 RepID=UPI00036D581D|nr:NAD(P)-dependent oxidoreductase [Longispora albida]